MTGVNFIMVEFSLYFALKLFLTAQYRNVSINSEVFKLILRDGRRSESRKALLIIPILSKQSCSRISSMQAIISVITCPAIKFQVKLQDLDEKNDY